MQKESNLRNQLLISACIIAGLAITGFTLTRGKKSEDTASHAENPDIAKVSDAGKRLADIEVANAEEVAPQRDLHTSGLITFPADQTVKIAPRLAGRVRQVFVTVGDRVSAGQTLAILDSVDAATAQTTNLQNENKLRLAKVNLDRQAALYRLGTTDVTTARAALDQARATTDAAKHTLDLTKQQERIGGFTQKPIEDASNAVVGANSALSQAKSDLRLAQQDYDRKKKLLEIGVIAKADLEVSSDTFEKAQTNVRADEESLTLAKEALDREQKAYKSNLYGDQQVLAAASAYRQALLQQAAAEKALRLAQAQILRDLGQAKSDYQAAKYDAENSRRALVILGRPNNDGQISVASPISGVITERDVSPGQVVDQSQMTPWQMFVVSNSKTVWVQTDVFEKDIAAVSPNAPVEVRVAAVPNQAFHGRVLRIAPTLDPKSRSVKVRVEIPNPDGLLRDGEYADATIHLDVKNVHPLILIPLSAVHHEGDKDFVYAKHDGDFLRRAVQLGSIRGDKCEILAGLSRGEAIVVHGAVFLGTQANGD